MRINFDEPLPRSAWSAVNDGVMGGRSSGGPSYENGYMVFGGVINTNGGGFSSVNTGLQPGMLTGVSGIKLRVRSDGRSYKLTMRTDARFRGRSIAFQAPIPETPLGEWADVMVSFEDLRPSIFGRPLRGATFDPSEVFVLGIILSDGIDGPFRLEVDSLETCTV